MAYATTNLYTGEVVKTFPNATDAEVKQAIEKAHGVFLAWKEISIAERVRILQNAADILRRDADSYAKLLTLEMGKIFSEAKAEVELSAKIFEYYVRNAERLLKSEKVPVLDPAEGEATLAAEPLGVLLFIEPWNFPYYQIVRLLAPQLAAGNALLLKHASNVPQCAAAFHGLMKKAGLPDGVFTNLYATYAQLETIINDPRVQGVALTGSEAAGSSVAAQAGKALKKSTMELGGADAFVVLVDADLEKTVNWAVFGRHWNGGQVCVNAKRMIIADKLYEEFLARYRRGVAELVAGDPMDPATTLAPLSSQTAADNLKDNDPQGGGLRRKSPGARAARAESRCLLAADNPDGCQRGQSRPLLGVLRPGLDAVPCEGWDEDDAVRIANDSPFGLGGSVFTSNPAHGTEVAKRISTGMVFVNHPTKVEADLLFGGVRHSGYGRELMGLGINEFVNHKLIDVVDIDAHF